MFKHGFRNNVLQGGMNLSMHRLVCVTAISLSILLFMLVSTICMLMIFIKVIQSKICIRLGFRMMLNQLTHSRQVYTLTTTITVLSKVIFMNLDMWNIDINGDLSWNKMLLNVNHRNISGITIYQNELSYKVNFLIVGHFFEISVDNAVKRNMIQCICTIVEPPVLSFSESTKTSAPPLNKTHLHAAAYFDMIRCMHMNHKNNSHIRT